MYDISTTLSFTQPSSLNTFNALTAAPASEQNQQLFLSILEHFMHQHHHHDLFEKIVSVRVRQITQTQGEDAPRGNLFTTLTSTVGETINGHQALDGLPPEFLLIERAAINLFGDILMCWAEFKSYQINEKAKKELQAHYHKNAHNHWQNTPEEPYAYEVVADIRNDERLFMTAHSPTPMTLTLANVLINLETFVKQQHWYEMLYYLDVSASGEHFVLYQHMGGLPPLLLSTALIQRYEQRDNWLTFDPFFQSDSWTLTLSSEKICTLESSGVFFTDLKSRLCTDSVEKFDHSLIQAVKRKSAVCEIIRMAISGPREKLNHILYLTLKYLTVKLADVGLEVAYTIVEQPSIIGFYQSVNSDSESLLPYVATSEQQVAGTSLVTYQGIVFTGPMSQAFEACSFRDYNKRIISMRKRARETVNV